MLLEQLQESIDFIRSKTTTKPKIGLVLGSGLGSFVDAMDVEVKIPFGELPNFVPPSVEGHGGHLVIGKIGGVELAVLQGRIHYYEGHSMSQVAFPVRCLSMLGIEKLVLTNAAGSLYAENPAGSFLIIEDHINLMGDNPLKGPNIQKLGPRFPDMSQSYDSHLIQVIEEIARDLGIHINKGIYISAQGPMLETPAEYRMLRILGGDAVGMSTIPEVITARHLGIKCCGLSILTDECDPDNLKRKIALE